MSAAVSSEIAAQVRLHGTSLVEAGAGTGKTHTIVSLYLRLLFERELSVSQILVVTYTVAATAELRDRIRSRLVSELALALAEGQAPEASARAARCREAIRDFDRAAIFSIHGFCQRALREHAFESGAGFESELVSDSKALLEEVAQDFWSRELHDAPRFQVAYARHARLIPSRLAELAGRLASRPDAELRPARPPGAPRPAGEGADLSALLSAWQSVHTRAAKLWASCGEEVIELLAVAAERKELNGNMYRPRTIRSGWRLAMDELMGRGEPGLRRRFETIGRLARSGLKVNKGCRPPEHRFFDVCEELVRADDRLDAALADWAAAMQQDFADYARQELESRKRERDILFFDDLLQRLRDALLPERGGDTLARAIRRRHPVALIDEFQDTDPIQYEIFRRVWHEPQVLADELERAALLLIGDPKQAIYAFRGADVFAYLDAREDAGGSVHGLLRNQRADPGLVVALNALFSSSSNPFAREEIPFEPALPRAGAPDALSGDRIHTGLRFLLAQSPDPAKEIPSARDGGPLVRAIAGEVASILAGKHRIGERALSPGDIAVLTRTNRQARAVQNALREHGIVSVLQSEESVFATHEARELERVMRALSEPENPSRLRAALATPLLSESADDLLALAEDQSETEWDVWTSRLGVGRRIWVEQGFLQAFRFLWVDCGIAVRLLARVDGERRVTNLLHLGELLQRASLEERLGPQALLYWFGRRRAEAERSASALAEDAQLRLESDSRAVQLLTIHRSKGLQYAVTICPFLWDGTLLGRNDPALRFHDPDSGSLVLDASSKPPDDSRENAMREAQEENLRVLYVALTRAKHHCSVVWGRFKGAATSPLAHFLHNPALGDLKKRKDAQLRADLEAIADRASGHICVEDWDMAPSTPTRRHLALAPEPAARLESRRALRRYSGTWRVSSFSGLVAGAEAGADEGRDYDSAASPEVVSDAKESAVTLADFPAGPMPGILIHEIFERLDFGAGLASDSDALEQLVGQQLERRGFAPRWQAPLVTALREVIAVPLVPGQPDSTLGSVPPANRIDEMEFVLPVASALTAAALARAFEAHATSPSVRRYAERAASLGFPTLQGHLRGFVDLIFRRGERWSLVDYKSNRLGPAREDYAPDALAQVMEEHDYVLQYHLYLVALHRHLSLRVAGYDYDRHVEGAFYLFVRGMSPAHAPGWGVVHDLPPRPLIEALSECLS